MILTNSFILNIYLGILVNIVVYFYIWLINGVVILVNTGCFNKTISLDKIR